MARARPEQMQILPVADARQLDTEQVCKAEDRRRLTMRVRTLSLNVKARLISTEP
jgi:hypothetical protein